LTYNSSSLTDLLVFLITIIGLPAPIKIGERRATRVREAYGSVAKGSASRRCWQLEVQREHHGVVWQGNRKNQPARELWHLLVARAARSGVWLGGAFEARAHGRSTLEEKREMKERKDM
jgi:hypothetical protein